MGDYMSEAEAEALGKQVAPPAGRVTWIVATPGTGVSRVMVACIRQASASGTPAFAWDPQLALAGQELPGETQLLYGDASLTEIVSVTAIAATQGCGLVVLSSLEMAGRGDRTLDRGLYDASGSLRAVASGRPPVAVLVSVHEPLGGFPPVPEGKTRDPRAFAFPFGEGFDGDRVVRLTPEGTVEELRP